MADGTLISFRLPADQAEQLRAIIDASGISTSEWMRGLVQMFLGSDPASGFAGVFSGASVGYMQARQLALTIAHALIDQAKHNIPATYDEAVARFGLVGGIEIDQ